MKVRSLKTIIFIPSDEEDHIAEFWQDAEMWGEMRYHNKQWLLEIFSSSDSETWIMDANEVLTLIQTAQERISALDQRADE